MVFSREKIWLAKAVPSFLLTSKLFNISSNDFLCFRFDRNSLVFNFNCFEFIVDTFFVSASDENDMLCMTSDKEMNETRATNVK